MSAKNIPNKNDIKIGKSNINSNSTNITNKIKKGTKSQINNLFGIPEKYQDFLFISLLVLMVYIFLGSAIFGNGIEVNSDRLASDSFKTYLEEAANRGEFPQWIPYIFGGMPSYGALLTTGDRWWDFFSQFLIGVTVFIGNILGNDTGRIAAFYSFYSIGIYLLLRNRKLDRFSSFLGGFAATFSTSVIIWVMIGHNTKPVAAACLPFILLFWDKLKDKFSFINFVLLAVVTHFLFESTHVQMIFYIATAIGIYFLYEVVSSFFSKENTKGILRAAGLMVISAGLAFMLSSDRYLSVMEYTPYSTRGSAPIKLESAEKTNSKNVVNEDGGNSYDYATQWSFSPQEMMTFFVPNYYGFGKLKYDPSEEQNQGTILNQFFQEETQLPTYFAQKPFEDAAPYMGILILFLAIYGSIIRFDSSFVKFLVILSFFSILISFGYTLPYLYDFFFYYIPSFNKFRAPSMALFLVQFAVPLLAAYGLNSIIKSKEVNQTSNTDVDDYDSNSNTNSDNNTSKNSKLSKNIKIHKFVSYFLYASVGFLVLGVIYNLIFQSSYFEAIAASKLMNIFPEQYKTQVLPDMQNFIWSKMLSDWYTNAIIVILGFVLLFLYIKDKINLNILALSIFALVIFDLWSVANRPLTISKTKVNYEETFAKSDVIDFLKQDKSVYRIVDFASPGPNMSAFYKLQNINGYHSAKMRVYQDLLDVCSNGSTSQMTDPFIWKLMNVKYILNADPIQGMQTVFTSQEKKEVVLLNPEYMPRSFFVDKVEIDKKENIIQKLKFVPNGNFNPKEVAYLVKKLPINIDIPTSDVKAKITKYQNELIELDVIASGNNLLFISEIYYPVGWKAYIDGKETEIFNTNYAFRSVIVPKGKHKVEFKYYSEKFALGKNLSLLTNVALVVLFGLGIFLERKKKNTNITNISENQ